MTNASAGDGKQAVACLKQISERSERYFDKYYNASKQKDVLMKRIFKRILSIGLRKSKRHKVKGDVYVKLEKSFRKNQIDDISLSGLSFYYIENGPAVGKGSRYLKLQAGECHTVEPIQFKVASDTNVGESMLPNNKIRRLSLHFEGLTFRQKRQLKNLIKHHSMETI